MTASTTQVPSEKSSSIAKLWCKRDVVNLSNRDVKTVLTAETKTTGKIINPPKKSPFSAATRIDLQRDFQRLQEAHTKNTRLKLRSNLVVFFSRNKCDEVIYFFLAIIIIIAIGVFSTLNISYERRFNFRATEIICLHEALNFKLKRSGFQPD